MKKLTEQRSLRVRYLCENGREQTMLILHASYIHNIPPHLLSWHKNHIIKCDFCHLSNSNKWNAHMHSEGPLWSLTTLSTDFRVGQKRGVGKKTHIRQMLFRSKLVRCRTSIAMWNNSQKFNSHQRALLPLKRCAVGNVQHSLCSYHQSKWLSHYGSSLQAAPVNNEKAALNLIWQTDHSSAEKPSSP